MAAVLTACATKPVGTASPAELPTLDDLHHRLEHDFAGTPVQLVRGEPGGEALKVIVPQPHGFDAGRSAVRPALAAVLDRIAEPLRRNARWRLQASGPSDPRSAAAQGVDRGAAVRDYLVMKGVPPARFVAPQRSSGAFTEIRLSERDVAPAR